MRAATKSALFAFVHGLRGQAMTRHRRIATGRPPRPSTLDLDEDEQRTSTRDQIDLDAIGTDVAPDDAIPSRFQKLGGLSFALVSEFLSWIRHGSVLERVRSHSLAAKGRDGSE